MEIIEISQSLGLGIGCQKDELEVKNFDDSQGETTELERKYGSLVFRREGKGRLQKVIVLNTVKAFKQNVQKLAKVPSYSGTC